MEYNTKLKKLILPEYGRNVQKMVNHLLSIEDRDERNRAARSLISIMGNLNPHLRDVNDFKHKLWDHLAIMSDFTLDIDSPYETPKKEILDSKPAKVPYNTNPIYFRHYGKAIELLIQKAIEMEEGEKKERFILIIANHMKKLYLTWNREAVADESIFNDIKRISKDQLKVPEGTILVETKDILLKNAPRQKNKQKKGKRYHSNYSHRN